MSSNLPNQQHGVLQGRQNPQGQNQTQQQPNILAGLAQFATKFSPNQNGQGGMSSLYSYGSSRTNYASLLGLEDTINEEQVKAQALNEGGTVAQTLVNICIHRKQTNPFYATWRAALERFKVPRKNLPQEPALVEFVNRIDSVQNLHHFILAQAGVQAGSEMGYALTQGDETIRGDRAKIQDIWYRCCVDTINLQFIDSLINGADGTQIFYRLSQVAKQVLMELEPKIYDMVATRYTFANVSCPYSKGNLTTIMDKSSTPNPLLQVADPTDLGFGGSIFDVNNPLSAGTGNDSADIRALNEFVRQKALGTPSQPVADRYEDRSVIHSMYNDYDRPNLRLEEMTMENRHKFHMNQYATNIPGTEWYLMRDEDAKLILKNMRKDDGTSFRWIDTRCVGTVPVYRLNWQEGTFNFRLVKHNLQVWDLMGTLLSNPEKLLPFMYEEDGVQKTTFDLSVLETDKFVRDNVVVPLGEMKDLEKEPNVLIGNRAVNSNQGNEATMSRLTVLTKTYDPKGKLDAFALPTVITREWHMEDTIEMDWFYDDFKFMVRGNKNDVSDTSRVLRHIKAVLDKYQGIEFAEFITPYLTNLVNRWLIEARGYTETKADALASPGSSYLRISNVFTDLDDLVQHLNNNDQPTLRAFLDYKNNDFLRSGIEILATPEDVKAEYESKYKSEEDEVIRAAMIKAGEKSILIKRDTLLLNMVKEAGPRTPDAVVIKKSGNPELFAIVQKSLNTVQKHFTHEPQILIKFNKDEGNKVWVATRSDFDQENVFVLRAISEGQEYCHPYPICE
ncbi:hypothetical protein PQD71_gp075 [Kosakonia phage Kc263]|uniref:Uncharacterized protein n=1 Tax=Kosakonia phage Kc263 TaxID=2863194 RepID=A0AAE7WF73_9CAUD|nr:hypothetical protein PQD71_gp075 [Kosakonia phage Kc263]QYN79968.1 hypothetical protein [Kosakonia phage Kc263]